MSSPQAPFVARHGLPGAQRPLRPWPRLAPVDKAPPPRPLAMGTLPPLAPKPQVRTRWQPDSMPVFPIEPANDPIRQLAADDRASLTLLALVLCVTVSIALLGFGLQLMQ
ncbi:MAG: hypothetical protein IT503_12640 [Burkholderiaceae bacterium]|nr:hypothetical protein [Ideonella sp.]MCC7287022.1 hypothetical protein [Burkholderiaceae bacterium]